MPNIVLTRIDNRLVHGQVATQWCGAIGANLILVANDEVAGNSLRQGLMNMAACLRCNALLDHPEDDRYHPQGQRQAADLHRLREPAGCREAGGGWRSHQESQHRQHAHVGRKAPSRHLRRS